MIKQPQSVDGASEDLALPVLARGLSGGRRESDERVVPPDSNSPKLELVRVSKIYDGRSLPVMALNNVSLQFPSGDFAILAGPSGSGKSTLLHLIGALDRPTSGEVRVAGRVLSSMNPNELADFRRQRIGFVFQAYNLINVLTAVENVEYIMLLQGKPAVERRRRAAAMLERVGLGGLKEKRPQEMSGGQQQRVAVARAVAADPEIVLADEPTANLDQTTGAALIDLFRELNKEMGVTFVLASHDPMVIAKSPRLIRLVDGRVFEDNAPRPPLKLRGGEGEL